jgi:hypothetical protein
MRKGLAWAFFVLGVGCAVDVVRQSTTWADSSKSRAPAGSTSNSEANSALPQNAISLPVVKVDFQAATISGVPPGRGIAESGSLKARTLQTAYVGIDVACAKKKRCR